MHIDIGSNFAALSDKMREVGKKFPSIVKRAVVQATTILYVESLGQLDAQIYDQPIPTLTRWKSRVKSGARKGKWRRHRKGKQSPAWKRTSTLRRGERMYFRNRGLDTEGVIDNPTTYAKARHDLNRPSPVDGKTRRAPWRDAALQRRKAEVGRVLEDAIDFAIAEANKPLVKVNWGIVE